MPPRKEHKRNPYKIALIAGTAAIVAAAVAVTATILIKNHQKSATPENAIKSSGIDTSNIGKIFSDGKIAAAVEIVPNKKPVIYFTTAEDGKWKYEKKTTVTEKSGTSEAEIFADKSGKQALVLVFAENKDTAKIKLAADNKTEMSPLAEYTAKDDRKVFAFSFSGVSNDTKTYTAVEYKADGKPLVSADHLYDEGSFHIICNGTDYNYKVSDCPDVAKSFKARVASVTPDFSVFKSKPDTQDNFVITYNSPVHTIITPKNFAKGAITYKSVSIIMPLEGEDNNLVFISGATEGMQSSKSPDTLKSNVLKFISGK